MQTMKALTFSQFGGPDVLEIKDLARPVPESGQVLVQMKFIGLNYADIYRRKGNYHLVGDPPFIAGYEGSGVVAESRSDNFVPGDRVAFADVPLANAEFVLAQEDHLIPVPDTMDLSIPAASLLQGLTAQYLAQDSHPISEGQWVLVHAASGGVGQFLTQMAKMKKSRVIGLTRSAGKLAVIAGCGADHALVLDDSWVNKVLEITNGRGVDVAYDSVGSTLPHSFEVTRDCGRVVFYGMSGADPEPVDPRMLMDTSKTLTGGDLWSYLTSAEQRRSRSGQLLGWISDGTIVLNESTRFSLAEGALAHRHLESGASAGKILLTP